MEGFFEDGFIVELKLGLEVDKVSGSGGRIGAATVGACNVVACITGFDARVAPLQ